MYIIIEKRKHWNAKSTTATVQLLNKNINLNALVPFVTFQLLIKYLVNEAMLKTKEEELISDIFTCKLYKIQRSLSVCDTLYLAEF